jgi:sugar phosphate isomerase/epimerase
MPQSQIACQLYTLRQYTKTAEDIARTFQRVKKIGYDAVQVSGMGSIDPKELAKILHNEGLVCCATHRPLDELRNEPEKVAENHALWNCKYTAIGAFHPKDNKWSAEVYHNFIRDYNEVGQKLHSLGLELGYHNHSHEFARFGNKTGMDLLWEGLSKDIWMEIDTYWVAHGGADPAAWIKKVAGRIPCVHLKDMAITPERVQQMAEIGEGNLNWPAVLSACRAAGVQWYIVEQDECQRDPFDSVEISLKNLKAMGIH